MSTTERVLGGGRGCTCGATAGTTGCGLVAETLAQAARDLQPITPGTVQNALQDNLSNKGGRWES
jgi:hypothetical protein